MPDLPDNKKSSAASLPPLSLSTPSQENTFCENVLPFIALWRASHLKTVLVTLVNTEGSSPRPPGAQMAVNEHGDFRGHISTGCLEPAIIKEARLALEAGQNRLVRFGKGSKYMDLKLPCGSGLDLYFDVNTSNALLGTLLETLQKRKPVLWTLNLTTGTSELQFKTLQNPHLNNQKNIFIRPYFPTIRLLLAGSGPTSDILAHLAILTGFEVKIINNHFYQQQKNQPCDNGMSPKSVTPSNLSPHRVMYWPENFADRLDAFTACALLFHEHDREQNFLIQILRSPSFYIGAMGSLSTHQARMKKLHKTGFSQTEIARIHAPIGAFPHAKSPPELATSILAQIMMEARRAGLFL